MKAKGNGDEETHQFLAPGLVVIAAESPFLLHELNNKNRPSNHTLLVEITYISCKLEIKVNISRGDQTKIYSTNLV